MPGEITAVNERVYIHKYTDPLSAADIEHAIDHMVETANKSAQSIYIITDASKITKFPANVLSLGLRPTKVLRSPKIASIIVINDPSAYFLSAVFSVITRMSRTNKILNAASQEEALEMTTKMIAEEPAPDAAGTRDSTPGKK